PTRKKPAHRAVTSSTSTATTAAPAATNPPAATRTTANRAGCTDRSHRPLTRFQPRVPRFLAAFLPGNTAPCYHGPIPDLTGPSGGTRYAQDSSHPSLRSVRTFGVAVGASPGWPAETRA